MAGAMMYMLQLGRSPISRPRSDRTPNSDEHHLYGCENALGGPDFWMDPQVCDRHLPTPVWKLWLLTWGWDYRYHWVPV